MLKFFFFLVMLKLCKKKKNFTLSIEGVRSWKMYVVYGKLASLIFEIIVLISLRKSMAKS